jgi:hypothetical protein
MSEFESLRMRTRRNDKVRLLEVKMFKERRKEVSESLLDLYRKIEDLVLCIFLNSLLQNSYCVNGENMVRGCNRHWESDDNRREQYFGTR